MVKQVKVTVLVQAWAKNDFLKLLKIFNKEIQIAELIE